MTAYLALPVLDWLLYALIVGTNALIVWKAVDLWGRERLLRQPFLPDLTGIPRPVAEVRLAEQVERLEAGLPLLATIASAAPFVGLAATVIHIMEALSRLGGSSADLAVIAGPIATSLRATLLGLLAAVPATVAYNLALRRVQVLENRARRALQLAEAATPC